MLEAGPPDLVSPRDGEQAGFAQSLRKAIALCLHYEQAAAASQDVALGKMQSGIMHMGLVTSAQNRHTQGFIVPQALSQLCWSCTCI